MKWKWNWLMNCRFIEEFHSSNNAEWVMDFCSSSFNSISPFIDCFTLWFPLLNLIKGALLVFSLKKFDEGRGNEWNNQWWLWNELPAQMGLRPITHNIHPFNQRQQSSIPSINWFHFTFALFGCGMTCCGRQIRRYYNIKGIKCKTTY